MLLCFFFFLILFPTLTLEITTASVGGPFQEIFQMGKENFFVRRERSLYTNSLQPCEYEEENLLNESDNMNQSSVNEAINDSQSIVMSSFSYHLLSEQ